MCRSLQEEEMAWGSTHSMSQVSFRGAQTEFPENGKCLGCLTF